jgi:leader peptidase (prepilin peptidase)/N-methyltransferase
MVGVSVSVSAAAGGAVGTALLVTTRWLLALPFGRGSTLLAAASATGLAALAGWRFYGQGTLPAMLWLISVGVVLSVVDLQCHRLPDAVVGTLFVGGVALLGIAAGHDVEGVDRLVRALMASGTVLCIGLLGLIVAGSGIGRGDVTFCGALALFLGACGWQAVHVGLTLGAVLLAAAAVSTLLARGGGRNCRLAAGPALFVGAIGAAFVVTP